MPEFNEIIILNVKIWELDQFYVVPKFFYHTTQLSSPSQ